MTDDIPERLARLEEGEEHRDKRMDDMHDDIRLILSDLAKIKERLYEHKGRQGALGYIAWVFVMIGSGLVGSISQRWLSGHN